jgi:hypothetical protein
MLQYKIKYMPFNGQTNLSPTDERQHQNPLYTSVRTKQTALPVLVDFWLVSQKYLLEWLP